MAGKPGRGSVSPRDKVVALRTLAQMGLPQPPKEECLSPDEAKEWTDIVVTYPADRFPRATWAMLVAYCRHTVEARRCKKMIAELVAEPDYSIRDYNMLLTQLTNQSKAVATFGVRLGIARTSMAGRHNNDPDAVAEHNLPWEA